MAKKARDKYLSVRLDPDERKRLQRRAELEHLETSTWARQVLLRTLDALDALDEQKAREEREAVDERRRRSVAEPPPPPPSPRPRKKSDDE